MGIVEQLVGVVLAVATALAGLFVLFEKGKRAGVEKEQRKQKDEELKLRTQVEKDKVELASRDPATAVERLHDKWSRP